MSFMENWPQHEHDLMCPFCGHEQSTRDYWECGLDIDQPQTLDCESCEKPIEVTRRAIMWFEIRPNEEQMRSPHCKRCQSEDFLTRYIYWDEHIRNAYHHDDQRPQGGKIERVFHDPPFQEYAA
jgi:hypothetical protein